MGKEKEIVVLNGSFTPPLKTGKEIIILGTGNSGKYCDFGRNRKQQTIRPNSEVWGVNGTYTIPRAMKPEHLKYFRQDKLFMTDTMFSHETGTLNFRLTDFNEFAQKWNCELISLNRMKLGRHILNAKPYPFKKIVEYFKDDYFTDTICYMIAYALYINSELAINPNGVVRPELTQPIELRLFGIDMATKREYQQSKGGVEHWLGIAIGMGAKVVVAPQGTIMRPPCLVPYGRWDLLHTEKLMKDYDPFGLMKGGKEPTTADADKMTEGIRNEQNNRNTNT